MPTEGPGKIGGGGLPPEEYGKIIAFVVGFLSFAVILALVVRLLVGGTCP